MNEHLQAQTKKQLGQFYTTQVDYIFTNMYNIPLNSKIIEPFAGNGDIIRWIRTQAHDAQSQQEIECYDIQQPSENTHRTDFNIIQRDTLISPPIYTNKFIITNPPYLARNKSSEKEIYDIYNLNDLYKCFISSFCNKNNLAIGGIIIIPLNFLCAVRKSDIELRMTFFTYYYIEILNIFEESVFQDTSVNVCSILFKRRNDDKQPNSDDIQNIHIYPQDIRLTDGWNLVDGIIGGDEIPTQLSTSPIIFTRLTHQPKTDAFVCNIKLYALDTGNPDGSGRIRLEYDTTHFVGIQTDRSFATIVSSQEIPTAIQKELVNKFNEKLEYLRKKYYSMFLSTFRESKDYIRKRISFKLVYLMLNHLLHEI
jgi:hypothetical protein